MRGIELIAVQGPILELPPSIAFTHDLMGELIGSALPLSSTIKKRRQFEKSLFHCIFILVNQKCSS